MSVIEVNVGKGSDHCYKGLMMLVACAGELRVGKQLLNV